ncbi:MAG TPA: dihydrodipicolinate synthase family protein [Candidatus Binataceae bacterium]|nr:dihydrodipicolinate synthase family protein [Candidatus Binataceae bacterium]
MSDAISGVIGACLTPFNAEGRVDYTALGREIDFLAADCDAISIAAVEAAEYTMLTSAERLELIRQGIALVARRKPVIAGASAPNPRAVLELADYGAKHGADLIQVLMPLRPWGPPPTTAELLRYFEQIAARTPLPIVVYHNPGPGTDPPLEAYLRIAELPPVRYFKESSRDVTKIGRLIAQLGLRGNVGYFTTMQPLLITLLLGGAGATMPPPGTRIAAAVVRAFRAGDLARASQWQRCFTLFPALFAAYGLPPVMKSALKHFGVDIGDPASPYDPVSPADHARIGKFFAALGVVDGGLPDNPQSEAAARALSQS